jgi:hypothetical protein
MALTITEARIEKALITLAQTDERFGELKAEEKRAERQVKSALALAKKSSNATSNAAKEDDALDSQIYKDAVNHAFEVTKELETLKAQRDLEHVVMDIWRTLEASRRRA